MGRAQQLLRPAAGFVPVDVPKSEYLVLVSLYRSLGGDNWTDNSNWLTDTTINNWYGVTVAGGHVTQINLDSNNLIGDIGGVDWNNLNSLTHLYLGGNASANGNINNLNVLTSVTLVSLGITGISGSLTDLSSLSAIRYLYVPSTNVSGGGISANVGVAACQVQNCGWSQATVDAFLLAMYTARAAYWRAAPTLNIGADDSVPSGVYQDATPPTTGLEYVFKLANDPDVEGFNTWTITYNGGVAP